MEIKSHKFDENKSFIKLLRNIKKAFFGMSFYCIVIIFISIYCKIKLDYQLNFKYDNYIKFIIVFFEFISLFYLTNFVIKEFNRNEDFSTNILNIETFNFGNHKIKYSKEEDLEYFIKEIIKIPQTVQKELYYICDSEISKLKIPILQQSIVYTSVGGVGLFLIHNIMILPLSVLLIIAAFALNYFCYEKEQYEQKKILLEESKRAILILQNVIK